MMAMVCMTAFLMTGCKTQRITIKNAEGSSENSTLGMISIMENRTHEFKTLKIKKLEVKYEMNGIKNQIKGSIAIYRDSLIAVSLVPALGYEVMRIICTKDSALVINRPEKIYHASSFVEYRRKYGIPVEFKDIQAMLANEVFYYKDGYKDRVYENKVNTRKENYLFIINAVRDGKRITKQGIQIDREGKRLESIFVVDQEQKIQLSIDYQDFEEEGNWIFPRRIEVDLMERNQTIRMEIKYRQIVFDDSVRVEFKVPKQYTREDI